MYACPNFESRALRRLHQCRAGLRHARARQHARRLRAGAGDRRTGRETRHRSAGAARPHRRQPGAARGAAHRRRTDRLERPPCARRGDRAPIKTRHRHGAIAVGRQRAGQCVLRGARPARRLGRGALQRAGHRHRHRHDAGAGGRRGTRPAPERYRRCASATPIFPPGPPSNGSRTTASITPPARNAAWQVAPATVRARGAGAWRRRPTICRRATAASSRAAIPRAR